MSDTGVELLVHIGMDTVNLEGKGFTTHVKQGDRVTKGQLLVEFDVDAIKAAGYSAVAPVIVTNADECGPVSVDVKAGVITASA